MPQDHRSSVADRRVRLQCTLAVSTRAASRRTIASTSTVRQCHQQPFFFFAKQRNQKSKLLLCTTQDERERTNETTKDRKPNLLDAKLVFGDANQTSTNVNQTNRSGFFFVTGPPHVTKNAIIASLNTFNVRAIGTFSTISSDIRRSCVCGVESNRVCL
jgi:hypothetical protein